MSNEALEIARGYFAAKRAHEMGEQVSAPFHGAGSFFFRGVLEYAEEKGALIHQVGATSYREGAFDAAAPSNWEGWPTSLLNGNAPFREAETWGYRLTETQLAVETANWIANGGSPSAMLLFAGHSAQCQYTAIWL